MTPEEFGPIFAFFNEIGIIEQLSRTRLESHLPDGLIAPHFGVLNHLVRLGDGRTPLQIAQAFQVPKTSMSHTLAVLQKRGLIEMAKNPEDARSKVVSLTEAGRHVREQAIASLAPDFREVLGHMDPERFKAALPFLAELRETMDRARDQVRRDARRRLGL